MSVLFKREKQLIIDGVKLPDLDLAFSIPFDDKNEPSFPDITVVNMSEDAVNAVKVGSEVILNAGYTGNVGNILFGTVSKKYGNIQNGVDTEFKFQVTPSVEIMLRKTVQETYVAGTKASYIVKDLLGKVNLEVGTIVLTNDISYPTGKIVKNSIQKELELIAKETDSWFYTRANIIFINTNVYELDTGFLLRPDTGLIGYPELIDIDGQVGYKITTLLNPMMTVGSVFRLESKYVNGLFRVHAGTHSDDFMTVMDCLPTDTVSRYVPPVKKLTDVAKGNTNKDKIWNYLIGKGFSKAAAAGVMGNFEWESHYDPTAENEIGAYGIAQWLDRRGNLEAFASQRGQDPSSLAVQLDFFWYEVTEGGEASSFDSYGGLNGFMNLTDPQEAARIFEECYERSGGSHIGDRQELAQAVYDWDGQTAGTYEGTGGDGNFPAGAFQCECGCGLDCVPELKDKMNQLWDKIGEIIITGPARCEWQNSQTPGAAPDSLHKTGEAADCYCPGSSVDYLADNAQNVGLGTIRYYSSGFVHCQTYPRDTVGD